MNDRAINDPISSLLNVLWIIIQEENGLELKFSFDMDHWGCKIENSIQEYGGIHPRTSSQWSHLKSTLTLPTSSNHV